MNVSERSNDQEWLRRWNPEILHWRAAAIDGQLILKECEECGRAHYYPRTLCPFCFSDHTVWKQSDGNGCIYTFAVERRGPQPFIIAYVTLDEGPIIMTRIVGVDNYESVEIGCPVELDAEGSRALEAPVFRLKPV
jgi:uncharacterized OB-fold protein